MAFMRSFVNIGPDARTRLLDDPTPHVPKVIECAFDHLHYLGERIFQCIAGPCGTERFTSEAQQDPCFIAAIRYANFRPDHRVRGSTNPAAEE